MKTQVGFNSFLQIPGMQHFGGLLADAQRALLQGCWALLLHSYIGYIGVGWVTRNELQSQGDCSCMNQWTALG